MIERFRPYLKYLKAVRGTIAAALLCGLVYGAANGAGLPLMANYVFPRVFPSETKAATDSVPNRSGQTQSAENTPQEAEPVFNDLLAGVETAPGGTPTPISGWELFLITLWLPAVFLIRGLSGYLNSYVLSFQKRY